MIIKQVMFAMALMVILVCSFSPRVEASNHTSAEVCGGSGRYFLGIPSWDRGLGSCENIDAEEFETAQKSKILINNLATIAVSLGSIIAVTFVIVGGFQFVLSSGNSEKATNARKTIINALIGLILAIMGRVATEIIYNNLTNI